jgi:hypothetical protein
MAGSLRHGASAASPVDLDKGKAAAQIGANDFHGQS